MLVVAWKYVTQYKSMKHWWKWKKNSMMASQVQKECKENW
jgi:hypothetical protein